MESYQISGLTFFYPERQVAALDSIDLKIKEGEFAVLCGRSGCGKSTLLRQLKPALAPHGRKQGEILFRGEDINTLSREAQSSKIGFVLQSPENQIVTDKVWHELAFGLESLGESTDVIRTRVAEMASFFGIQNWFYKSVTELSGGQKQLLNLASIMAMQPSVLILDEPTSQLDPIAASDFLATIGKINRELGVTVILTEHRLEEALPLCGRVLVMEKGRLIADGSALEVGNRLKETSHDMFSAFPTPMRIWAAVENDLPCPVTVRDGREWLDTYVEGHNKPTLENNQAKDTENAQPVTIELKEAFFRYEKDAPDILKGMSLKAHRSELFALVGGNGTGKTTALSVIAGLNKAQRGEVYINGEKVGSISDSIKYQGVLGILPQNPQALFVSKTVEADLYEMLVGRGISKQERERLVREIVELCELEALLESHPYDLSGGEQQRAALAKVLLLEPQILLLDEPTKGMDAEFKKKFAGLLKRLTISGVTVFMVSHDVEFCAEYADRVAMCFDGNIVSEGNPRRFFTGNSFYTTAANRMARAHISYALTAGDVIRALGGKCESDTDNMPKPPRYEKKDIVSTETRQRAEPKKRNITLIAACAVLLLATCVYVQWFFSFFTRVWSGELTRMLEENQGQAFMYVLLLAVLCVEVLALLIQCFPGKKNLHSEWMPKEKRRLSKRTLAAMAMVLVAIPLTIYVGIFYFGDRRYYFISLLIILETMLPFVLVFEGRSPQARELVIIAVLCAIGVAGRAAFFMLPQFKPVVAVVIIAGVAFGGETGFLVGAMTGFASNFFFGQGPWTPWQMFAFGIIGFFAGLLFKKGLLSANRIALAIFGGLATLVIYGGIMNSASVLMYQAKPTAEMFWLAWLRGVPLDLVHAIATIFFMIIASEPMLEKLDRIKIKYGLIAT